MADVFLSYASEDRDRAGALARRLEEAGFTLWWDRHIPAGADFAEAIEREIAQARRVVVCWSENGARSRWVRDEAAYAERHAKLVPLLLSGAEPPLGFRQVQALDFRTWSGEAEAPCFVALKAALGDSGGVPADVSAGAAAILREKAAVATGPVATSPAASRSAARPRRIAVIALALLALAAAAIGLVLRRSPPIAAGEVAIAAFTATKGDEAAALGYADSFRQRLTDTGISNAREGSAAAARSEFVLDGAVTREEGGPRLVVHLFDRRSGATLWSWKGAPTEGAAWEANVAAFALNCALDRRDPARGPGLLSRYLYGCAAFLTQNGDASMYDAASQAAKIAPDDPRALGFLAVAAAAESYIGTTSAAESRRFADESGAVSARALAIDKTNGDAIFAQCFAIPERDYARLEKCLRAAVDVDPEGWSLGRYAQFLIDVGRAGEALDLDRRANEKRLMFITRTASLLASEGDLRAGLRYLQRIRPFDPPRADSFALYLEAIYGDVDDAERQIKAHPDVRNAACVTLVIRARRNEKIGRGEAREQCGGGGPVVRVLTLSGDLDGAFAEIEDNLRTSPQENPSLFDSVLNPLRVDPRFWRIAGRLGLVDYWLDSGRWPDFCAQSTPPVDCRTAAESERRARVAANTKAEK